MSKIFLVLLIAILPLNQAFAQTENDPKTIWQEYLATNPTAEHLYVLIEFHGIKNPYREWVLDELFLSDYRGIDRFHLVGLLGYEMKNEQNERLWQKLDPLTLEELGRILIGGTEENQRRAFDILNGIYLTNDELARLLSRVQDSTFKERKLEIYYEKILERFFAQNPSNEDLFVLAESYYMELALKELLKRPLDDNELFYASKVYYYGPDDYYLAIPDYTKEALSRISLSNLNDYQLETIKKVNIEPYSSGADQVLEARNYDLLNVRREELRQLMIESGR